VRDFTSFPPDDFPIIAVVHPEHRTWTQEELLPVMIVGRSVLIDRDSRYPHILALIRWQLGRKRLRSKLNIGDENIEYFRHGRFVNKDVWRKYECPGDDLKPVPRVVWHRKRVQVVDFDWLARKLFELRRIDTIILPSEEDA